MGADEVREGLARLGILHETTLPACPEQNGKQEAWWNSVEGRLLAMLERVPHFRAMKCTREHGGASHVREVRMEGRGFDLYNNLAVGMTWAAERIAVAYLDASALEIRGQNDAEPCMHGDALAQPSTPSDACS